MKRIFFIFSFFLFSFFLGLNVFAAEILQDDFSSYAIDSELNGQGGWFVNIPSRAIITDEEFKNDDRSLRLNDLVSATHSISAVSTGTTSFWFNIPNNSGESHIVLKSGSTNAVDIYLEFISSFVNIYLASSTSNILVATTTKDSDQWHNIRFEFSGLTDSVRLSLDFGSWSDWVHARNNFSSVDSYNFSSNNSSGSIYFDDIRDLALNYDSSLTFLFPTYDAWVDFGEQNVFGKCPVVGYNRLAIFPEFKSAADLSISDFTITCDSDYNWHATTYIYQGYNALFIYDLDYLTSTNTVDSSFVYYYGLDKSSSQFQLGIVYPPDNGSHSFALKYSDNYKFKFNYFLPSFDLASSTSFVLTSFGNDSQFSSPASEITNSFLSSLDSEQLGTFIIPGILASSTPQYYQADLYSITSSTDLVYRLRFLITASDDDSAPPPIDPDNADCGFICNSLKWAFLPSRSSLQRYYEIPSLLNEKIPFYYFNYLEQKFSAVSLATTSPSIEIPIVIGGVSSSLKLFDLNEPVFASFVAQIRPFMIAVVWYIFLLYLFDRVINIWKR